MYEIGLAFAAGVFVLDQLHLLIRYFGSFESSNYGKINFFYNPLSGRFIFMREAPSYGHQAFKYLIMVCFTAPFLLLSWAFVAYRLYFIIIEFRDNQLIPEPIKQCGWEVRKRNLNQMQMIKVHLDVLGIYSESNAKELKAEIDAVQGRAA